MTSIVAGGLHLDDNAVILGLAGHQLGMAVAPGLEAISIYLDDFSRIGLVDEPAHDLFLAGDPFRVDTPLAPSYGVFMNEIKFVTANYLGETNYMNETGRTWRSLWYYEPENLYIVRSVWYGPSGVTSLVGRPTYYTNLKAARIHLSWQHH